MTRLTALDALGRGLANVRGNAALVVAATAGSIAVVLVVALGLVPWLGSLGLGLDDLLTGSAERVDPQAWLAWLADPLALLRRAGGFLLSFGFALTVGSIVYSWYLGGVLGVLAAGDAQAPPGAGRPAVAFRTWSWRLFAGESTRLVWRVLIFYSILMLLWLVLAVAAGLLAFAAVSIGIRSGVGAAFGIGCGGALPLLFAAFVLYAGTLLGQADLPREGSRGGAAVGVGFRVLGRRLGASILLSALLFGAALAIGLGFALVDFLLELVTAQMAVVAIAVRAISMIVQLLISSWLNLVFMGAFLALLRSERAIEAPAAA